MNTKYFISEFAAICSCIALIIGISPGVTNAANQLPKGYLDMADCNYIGGWTCDPDAYSASLDVHFYIDGPAGTGKFLSATTANIARETGVANSCGGYANHGYLIPTPDSLKDGKSHTVYAYAINTPAGGTNPVLTNSGKVVKCTAATACTANTTSGCKVCKSDGSAWVDDNSKCASGTVCNLGTCVKIGVTLGAAETVFDYSAAKCETNDIPDISARAFIDSDGKTQLMASHYKSYRMIGSNLASVKKDCSSAMSSDFNSDASKFNDHEWIAAPYTLDGTKVYALMHNEYQGHLYTTSGTCATGQYRDCWYNSITSAVSTDSGKTYTHGAAPAHLVLSSPFKYNGNSAGPIGYFEPSNIIKGNDGYYYAFIALSQPTAYNGQTNPQPSGICVMRTDEIKELSGTGNTVWKLWDGTGFNIENKNPYTQTVDPATQACKPVNNEYAEFRSVVWNTYLNQYIGTGISYDSSNNKWFTLAFSDDLINWTSPQKFRAASNTSTNNEVYTSIIDPEVIVNNANIQTKNFEKSDSSFYLYFTRINDGNMDRDLIRIPVGILKAGQVCAPGAGNGCKICNSAGSAWVDDSSLCSSGQTCSSGVCTTPCSNECTASGIAQCSGTSIKTCGNYDTDSCLEWSTAAKCGTSKTCFNNKCISSISYSPTGYFDSASCTVFTGWSCDKNDYSYPLTINFYADGTSSTGKLIGSATANVTRESAVGSLCGGYTAHGFSFTIPSTLKDGKTHTIYAYAVNIPANTNTLLSSNPKKVTCSK